jgi:hypothetical protein
MPEVTEELRRWRRRLALDIAAWTSAPAVLGLLGLLSWVGWVSVGEMEWLAIAWFVISWVFTGGYRLRRTVSERPEPTEMSDAHQVATSALRSWRRRLRLDLAACVWPAIAYGILSAVWPLGVLGIDETTLHAIGWVMAGLVLLGTIRVIRTLRRRPIEPAER